MRIDLFALTFALGLGGFSCKSSHDSSSTPRTYGAQDPDPANENEAFRVIGFRAVAPKPHDDDQQWGLVECRAATAQEARNNLQSSESANLYSLPEGCSFAIPDQFFTTDQKVELSDPNCLGNAKWERLSKEGMLAVSYPDYEGLKLDLQRAVRKLGRGDCRLEETGDTAGNSEYDQKGNKDGYENGQYQD